jgi:hypothetical protein
MLQTFYFYTGQTSAKAARVIGLTGLTIDRPARQPRFGQRFVEYMDRPPTKTVAPEVSKYRSHGQGRKTSVLWTRLASERDTARLDFMRGHVMHRICMQGFSTGMRPIGARACLSSGLSGRSLN